MKELKFRAWDGDRYWYSIVPSPIRSRTIDICKEITSHEPEYWNMVDVIEGVESVEQYTGLKDKNGKEIYENDIVEYTTCYYGNEKRHRKVVEWKEWDSDDFGEPHNIGYRDLSEYMVIVGNIHENADLLERK